jgi:hypothetical protein
MSYKAIIALSQKIDVSNPTFKCSVRIMSVNNFRHFDLILQRDSAVLADDFKVVAVDEHNVEKIVKIQPTIYHGYLAGLCSCFLINRNGM